MKPLLIIYLLLMFNMTALKSQNDGLKSPLIKNGKYSYIPEYDYEKSSNNKAAIDTIVPNGQSLLMFDVEQGKSDLRFYNLNKSNIPQKYSNGFKAVVGNYVTLKVYSETGDSVSITSNYTNLHLENQDQFLSVLNKDTPDSLFSKLSTILKISPIVADSSIQSTVDIINQKVNTLTYELNIYLQYITTVQPLKKQWNNDILYIKENICKNFGLTDFSLGDLDKIIKNSLVDDQWKAIMSYNPPIYFSTLPKQIKNNDIVTFNVQLFNKGKSIQSESYSYYTQGGFKVDYSVGLVFHTLTDQSLSIKETTDNTNSYKTIVAEQKNSLTPGAGLFAHFYGRTGGWFNYGLMTGFELGTDSKPKYLAGISFLIGREQRIVISPGIILGQVKVLSSKYDVNIPYLSSSFGNLSVDQILVDQYKFGYFVSISYNLSK